MFSNAMFPSDPKYPLIHTRRYEVRAYRMSDERFLLRGVVVDEKPAGLYITGDPDPIWMHHMIVDLEIVFPTFLIEKASAEFKNHPHLGCTQITDHYKKLEGMSISRGFNAKVRELFAASRGCTHITALLAAMGPVAIQTGWSMRVGSSDSEASLENSSTTVDEHRKRQFATTINSCHLWAQDGELATKVLSGDEIEVPLPISIRLAELGRSDDEWRHGRN